MRNYFKTLLLFFSFAVFSQEKSVFLIEEKLKKSTIVYVQNDTDTNQSVFLKINPIGYRRSAQKPIIKNIPAKGKIQMTTLIPLADQESSYTYDLIVNKELENIDVKRQKSKSKEVPPQTVSKYKLFVFTAQNCKRCDSLKHKLNDKKIKFLEVNIDGKNNLLSPVFWRKRLEEGYTRENIKLPFAKKDNKLFYPIEDFDVFIENLYPKPKSKGIKIKIKKGSLF